MVIIREEQPGDISAIYQIHASSFPSEGEARLVDLLRDHGQLPVSLVAEIDGKPTGHIAFSPVTVASGEIGVGLAPIAVGLQHRKQGVGSKLVLAGLKTCRDTGFGWCVVLGEPHFYGRFGFRPASELGLSDEYGGGSAFQVIELIPASAPASAGLVKYASEFATLC